MSLLASEIALHEGDYCCFRRITTMFTINILVYACVSSMTFASVSYMPVPIVMYGLRLFIVVLKELQCLQGCVHVDIIRVIDHFTKFCLSTPFDF